MEILRVRVSGPYPQEYHAHDARQRCTPHGCPPRQRCVCTCQPEPPPQKRTRDPNKEMISVRCQGLRCACGSVRSSGVLEARTGRISEGHPLTLGDRVSSENLSPLYEKFKTV